ncbi:hypothetical protein MPS_4193 [Mycobacterium pseudoshottsii JCM 15466]|nr:hypothetical protein MPS_4193 [Mycobacterium pseudoshottsii JCM 15466]
MTRDIIDVIDIVVGPVAAMWGSVLLLAATAPARVRVGSDGK